METNSRVNKASAVVYCRSAIKQTQANEKVLVYLIFFFFFSVLFLKYQLGLSIVKHFKIARALSQTEATLWWQMLLLVTLQPSVPSTMGDTQQLQSKFEEGELAAHS